MRIYQSPNKVDWASVLNPLKKSIFLAGGISGCRDWQSDLIEELQNLDSKGLVDFSGLCIFNPRRETFDVTDESAAIEQIKWEHKCLEECDICSFFFPSSKSVQPITLYELGKHMSKHSCVVGIQKGYLRTEDVKIQLSLDDYFCSIYDTYEEAIREHARRLAIIYKNVRRNR